jgi:hypothetical protein
MKALVSIFFRDPAGAISSRKIIAMIFVFFAMIEKAKLIFWSHKHFSVALKNCGVSDAVVITLIASLDALAVLCLAVYGIKKTDSSQPAQPSAPAEE